MPSHTYRLSNGDILRLERDLIDATSMHRPDTNWRYTDKAGHEHRWFVNGQAADDYRPEGRYDVPSLVWVKDGVGYYEDGEEYEIGHNECRQCGEHIDPRHTADTCTQYIAGMMRCYINDEPVSREEYEKLLASL